MFTVFLFLLSLLFFPLRRDIEITGGAVENLFGSQRY